jgi:hypothetical protein
VDGNRLSICWGGITARVAAVLFLTFSDGGVTCRIAWQERTEGAATDDLLRGSVVQRLQRFSTYGSLKQLVLKLIADEAILGSSASASGAAGSHSSSLPAFQALSPELMAGRCLLSLQVLFTDPQLSHN